MTALEEIKSQLDVDMSKGITTVDRLRIIAGGIPDFDPITVEDAEWIIAALESLQRENEALQAQALRDRKLRDEAQHDALLWQYSIAVDWRPPLLVTVWEQRREAIKRAEAAEAEVKKIRELLQFSYDTLLEINPSNYDHDDVCAMNSASVEVMLAIAPELSTQALASTGGEHNAE